jgi:hypothetical protein
MEASQPGTVTAMTPTIERYREHLAAGRLEDAFQVAWPEGSEEDGLFLRLEDAGAYGLLRQLAEPFLHVECRAQTRMSQRQFILAQFLGRALSSLGDLAGARATHLAALEGYEHFGRAQREPSLFVALASLELGDITGFLHWTRFLSQRGSNCENSIPKANALIGVALVRLRVTMTQVGADLFGWSPWPELWCDAAAARIALGHFGHTAVRAAMRPPDERPGEARYTHLVSALWFAARSAHDMAADCWDLAAASASDVGDAAFHVRVLTERARAASRSRCEPVDPILDEALALARGTQSYLVLLDLYEVARSAGRSVTASGELQRMTDALRAGVAQIADGLVKRWTRLWGKRAEAERRYLEGEVNRLRAVASRIDRPATIP